MNEKVRLGLQGIARKRLTTLSALFLLLLFSGTCQLYADKDAPANKTTPLDRSPKVSQGLEGGVWRLDDSFESTLAITNVLKIADLTVTPVLYMEDGTRFALAPITIPAASAVSINIEDALSKAPAAIKPHLSVIGSAGVEYQWPWTGAVLAGVSNIDEIRRLSFYTHLHADVARVHDIHSHVDRTVEGMWWKQTPNTDATLYLTNTALTTVPTTVTIFDAGGKTLSTQALTAAPHSTQAVDFASILAGTPAQEGGFRVTYNGPSDALSIDALAMDEVAGYSAELPAFEVRPQAAAAPRQVSYAVAGMMTGAPDPKMLFPSGTVFKPYAVLRNTAAASRQVGLSASYMVDGTEQRLPLPAMTLAPGATARVDVAALLAAANVQPRESMNLEVSFAGQQGDVLLSPGSTDASNDFVFQVGPSLETTSYGKIICYWNTAGDTSTMISLWNYSGKDQSLLLNLSGPLMTYSLPVTLKAGESREIDIAQLMRLQTPDRNGAVLPRTMTEGTATLTAASGIVDPFTVATNAAIYNVRNATCGVSCMSCNGIAYAFINPASIYLQINSQQQAQAMVHLQDGSTVPSTQVAGTYWSTAQPPIATVDTVGMTKGVSPGPTSLLAFINPFSYPGVGIQCVNTTPYSCPSAPTFSPTAGLNVFSVSVNSADVTQNAISISLNGPQASGQLTIQLVGSPSSQTIYQGTASSGTASYSFNLQNLSPEEVTSVSATWIPQGEIVTASLPYHIRIIGMTKLTQYNTPAESQCSGAPQADTIYDNNCKATPASLISGFIFRVTDKTTGTGSGQSINFGGVKQEMYCTASSPALREKQIIAGTYGTLNNSTLAACRNSPDYTSGAQIYIVGVGIKTVTDQCPGCCKDLPHFDNYSTSGQCSGLGSFPSAITVRIY